MDSVAITIADGAGTVVRELKGGGACRAQRGHLGSAAYRGRGRRGDRWIPGRGCCPGATAWRWQPRADTLETSAEVRFDPRVTISRGDLVARHDAMMDSYRLSGAVGDANDRIESMTGQLDAVEERVDDAEEAPEGLTEEIEAFREALDEVDEELGDVSGGASVWGTIQSSSSLRRPPTSSGRSTAHGRSFPP